MGFYNYEYVTVNTGERESMPSLEFTEGNHFETENFYEILVYYRALGGRSDQLVGVFTLNSMGDIK